MSRQTQLKAVLKEIAWTETRQHDDLVLFQRRARLSISNFVIPNVPPCSPQIKPNGRNCTATY